jgi:hypothetical protein
MTPSMQAMKFDTSLQRVHDPVLRYTGFGVELFLLSIVALTTVV